MNVDKLQIATFAKAVAAFLTALAGALSVAATQDGLTGGESVASTLAAVLAGVVTYTVPNKAKTAPRRRRVKATPDKGE